MGYLRRIKNRERRIEKAKNLKRNNVPKDNSVRSRLRRAAVAKLKQEKEAQAQREANAMAQEMADYKEVNQNVRENPEAYEKFLETEGVEIPQMYVDQRNEDDDYIKVEENDTDSKDNGSDADGEDVGSTSEPDDSEGS